MKYSVRAMRHVTTVRGLSQGGDEVEENTCDGRDGGGLTEHGAIGNSPYVECGYSNDGGVGLLRRNVGGAVSAVDNMLAASTVIGGGGWSWKTVNRNQ